MYSFQVSAQQRAGRAGRTSAGKCYRLYSKKSYEAMMDETVPEIKRANLANTMLYLKVLGIKDVVGFHYLDRPEEDSVLDALKQLYVLGMPILHNMLFSLTRVLNINCLGALSDNGSPTEIGKQMAQFPLEPRLARYPLPLSFKLSYFCIHVMI